MKFAVHKATGVRMMCTKRREKSNDYEVIEVEDTKPTPKPKAKAKAKVKAPAKVADPAPIGDDDIDELLNNGVDD